MSNRTGHKECVNADGDGTWTSQHLTHPVCSAICLCVCVRGNDPLAPWPTKSMIRNTNDPVYHGVAERESIFLLRKKAGFVSDKWREA
jgi:hypothetical protein